jgi:Protein of unknown function (DUF3349)
VNFGDLPARGVKLAISATGWALRTSTRYKVSAPKRTACEVGGCHVSLGDLVARIVAFVRAGYPQGVPETDYIPLLALLRRRLSDDEVAAVAAHLAGRGELHADTADIGTAITKITDELPSLADLDRVQRRLEAIGFPAEPDD